MKKKLGIFFFIIMNFNYFLMNFHLRIKIFNC